MAGQVCVSPLLGRAVTFLVLVPAVHVAMGVFGATDGAPAERQPSRPSARCACFVTQAA
jgi:hypothetical protein